MAAANEDWWKGSCKKVKFSTALQRFAFKSGVDARLSVEWLPGGNAKGSSLATWAPLAGFQEAPPSAIVCDIDSAVWSAMFLQEPLAAAPPVPSIQAPAWRGALGSVTLKCGDVELVLSAPPAQCARFSAWLKARGVAVPDDVARLLSGAGSGAGTVSDKLSSASGGTGAVGAAFNALGGAGDAVDAATGMVDAAAGVASGLGTALSAAGRVADVVQTVGGAAVRVLEKITTLAQFVPFVGPAAQALLCLRDGVQAIAGHEGEVADFAAVLALYARALQDIAPLLRAGPEVSASLRSAFESFHDDIRSAMEGKAAALSAAASSATSGWASRLAGAVKGTLVDTFLCGEDQKLAALTASLRGRLPEFNCAIGVETLRRVAAATDEQRAACEKMERLCAQLSAAGSQSPAAASVPFFAPQLWSAAAAAASRPDRLRVANPAAEAIMAARVAASASSRACLPVVVLPPWEASEHAAGSASALSAWATDVFLADRAAAGAPGSAVQESGGGTVFVWLDASDTASLAAAAAVFDAARSKAPSTGAAPAAMPPPPRQVPPPWVVVASKVVPGSRLNAVVSLLSGAGLWPPPSSAPVPGAAGGTLVILSDDPTSAAAYGAVDSASGVRAQAAGDAASAIEALRASALPALLSRGGTSVALVAVDPDTVASRRLLDSGSSQSSRSGTAPSDDPSLPGSVQDASGRDDVERDAVGALGAVRAVLDTLAALPAADAERLADVEALLQAALTVLTEAVWPMLASHAGLADATPGEESSHATALAACRTWAGALRSALTGMDSVMSAITAAPLSYRPIVAAAVKLRARLVGEPPAAQWRSAWLPAPQLLDVALDRALADTAALVTSSTAAAVAQSTEALTREMHAVGEDVVAKIFSVEAAVVGLQRDLEARAQAQQEQLARQALAVAEAPDRRAALRAELDEIAAAITTRVLERNATLGAVQSVFGLPLEAVAAAHPGILPASEVARWSIAASSSSSSSSSSPSSMEVSSGQRAMNELLCVKKGGGGAALGGVRVLIGAAGQGKSWLFRSVASLHAAAALGLPAPAASTADAGAGAGAPSSAAPSSTVAATVGPSPAAVTAPAPSSTPSPKPAPLPAAAPSGKGPAAAAKTTPAAAAAKGPVVGKASATAAAGGTAKGAAAAAAPGGARPQPGKPAATAPAAKPPAGKPAPAAAVAGRPAAGAKAGGAAANAQANARGAPPAAAAGRASGRISPAPPAAAAAAAPLASAPPVVLVADSVAEPPSSRISGADLKERFSRVLLIRLRDLSVEGGVDWAACATAAEVTALLVAAVYDVNVALRPPSLVAEALFAPPVAARTLWLLDGFDELPGAAGLVEGGLVRDAAQAFLATARKQAPVDHRAVAAAPLAAGTPADRLAAVMRVFLTQPFVVMSSRPQFEGPLGHMTDPSGRDNGSVVRVQLLRPVAVRRFAQAVLAEKDFALLQARADAMPALAEAMRTPVLMLISLAAHRRTKGADASSSGAGDEEDDSVEPAGGSLDDKALEALEQLSAVAGLYVRAERVLAQQLASAAAGEPGWGDRRGRAEHWKRLRGLLTEAALDACSRPGTNVVALPRTARADDAALLGRGRVLDFGLKSSLGEFQHRSIQEYFAAAAAAALLASPKWQDARAAAPPPDAQGQVVRALSDPANDMLRLLAMALCPSQAAANRLASALVAAEPPAHASEHHAGAEQLADGIAECRPDWAAALACRAHFDGIAAQFWAAADSVGDLADRLFSARFWAVADAVANGAHVDAAVTKLVAFAAQGGGGTTAAGARAAVLVLTRVGRFRSPEVLRRVLAALSGASQHAAGSGGNGSAQVASEAAFALAVLTPGRGLRERLLQVALAGGAAVEQATTELANRFAGDRDVSARLLELAKRDARHAFVIACTRLPGARLVSLEAASAIFEAAWVTPEERASLAVAVWDAPLHQPPLFVPSASVLPLHVAAACGIVEFVRAACDSPDGSALTAVDELGRTPLHWAAREGCVDAVAALLEAGAPADAVDADHRRTPLHWAAIGGHTAVLRALLDKGAPAGLPDGDGCLPLHHAARWGHGEAADALLLLAQPPFPVDALDVTGATPLGLAARWGAAGVVALLLDRSASASPATGDVDFGRGPLHWAAREGHSEIVAALLDRGAPIDARDTSGRTALHLAVRGESLPVVALLLARGAQVDALDGVPVTPLAIAELGGYRCAAIASVLREAGAVPVVSVGIARAPVEGGGDPVSPLPEAAGGATATVDSTAATAAGAPAALVLSAAASLAPAPAASSMSPLYRVSTEGQVDAALSILDAGADVNETGGPLSRTALHAAAREGHAALVSALLARGANVAARDNFGRTPLFDAVEGNHIAVVADLLSHGAAANVSNKDGRTPLHVAARDGLGDVVSNLLAHGADHSALDCDGRTALHLAGAHLAADTSCTAPLAALIAKGADINLRYGSGGTLLHWAVEEAPAAVPALVGLGADIFARARNSRATPLDLACARGDAEGVCRMLTLATAPPKPQVDDAAGQLQAGPAASGVAALDAALKRLARLPLSETKMTVSCNLKCFEATNCVHHALCLVLALPVSDDDYADATWELLAGPREVIVQRLRDIDKDAISATMLEQLAPIIADPQFTFAEGFSAMVACVCAFVRALYDYAVKHRNGTGAPSKSSVNGIAALDAALSGLAKQPKSEWSTLRSFARPPPAVNSVLHALSILFALPVSAGNYRVATQALLAGPTEGIVQRLRDFDRDAISASVIEQLAPLIADPKFTYDTVREASSVAAFLCAFVRALYDYTVQHRGSSAASAPAAPAEASIELQRSGTTAASGPIPIVSSASAAAASGALAALDSALALVGKLRSGDVSELKAMRNPPGHLLLVARAVLTVFRDPAAAAPSGCWQAMSRRVADPGFLRSVLDFDRDTLDADLVARLQPVVTEPGFTVETLKRVSNSGAVLCAWVLAVYEYYCATRPGPSDVVIADPKIAAAPLHASSNGPPITAPLVDASIAVPAPADAPVPSPAPPAAPLVAAPPPPDTSQLAAMAFAARVPTERSALRALDAALKRLASIKSGDFSQLRAIHTPPPPVLLTAQAVCILLGFGDGKRSDYWALLKLELRPETFQTRFRDFDKGVVAAATIARLQPILSDPEFAIDAVRDSSPSALCAALCEWIHAIHAYWQTHPRQSSESAPDTACGDTAAAKVGSVVHVSASAAVSEASSGGVASAEPSASTVGMLAPSAEVGATAAGASPAEEPA